MKCNEMEFLISLHIDNQLSDQEQKELLQHFEVCDQCRQTYKDFLNIRSFLSKENNIEISPDFEKNLMKKIKTININKTENVFHPNHKRKIILLAAGLLFVVISSVSFFPKKLNSIEYDFGWYYDISQENNDDSSTGSTESFLLNS